MQQLLNSRTSELHLLLTFQLFVKNFAIKWCLVTSNFYSPTTIFKISCEISISSYLTNYNTTGFECDFQGVIIAFALDMWGTKRFLIISTPDHTWLMDMCSGEVVIHYSLQLLSKENTSSNGENPIPCLIQWGTH